MSNEFDRYPVTEISFRLLKFVAGVQLHARRPRAS